MTAPTATATARKATVPCAQCQTLNRVDLSRLSDGPRCAKCKTPIALDHPVPVSDANFDRVVADSPVPVLVDFYADWCAPCHAMAPHLDAYAQRNAGSVLVTKVDTDHSPTISQRFNIRSIPTLAVFVGGKEAGREIGAVPPQRLEALVTAARAKAS
jgi:thioredoxin 2